MTGLTDAEILEEIRDAEWRTGQMSEQNSRDLAEDLAATLRVSRDNLICYTEMGCLGGFMDVWAMKPGWGDRDVRCYEVKISRADFWSDVNAGKFEKYLPFCKRFYFAVPAGLVKKAEIPQGCGLITKGPNGWRTVVPATPHEATGLTQDYLLSVMREIHYREHRERYDHERSYFERYFAAEDGNYSLAYQKAGSDIARKVRIAEKVIEQVGDHRGLEYSGISAGDPDAERCYAAFQELAAEIWPDGHHLSPERLAEVAVAMIRHADSIREMGSLLQRLPYRALEEVQSTIERASS